MYGCYDAMYYVYIRDQWSKLPFLPDECLTWLREREREREKERERKYIEPKKEKLDWDLVVNKSPRKDFQSLAIIQRYSMCTKEC